jgi:hypothetical protein
VQAGRQGSSGGAAVGPAAWRARWPRRTGRRPNPWPGRTGRRPNPWPGRTGRRPNPWPGRTPGRPNPWPGRTPGRPNRWPTEPVAGEPTGGRAELNQARLVVAVMRQHPGRCGARSASPAAGLGPQVQTPSVHTSDALAPAHWLAAPLFTRHARSGDSSPEMHGLMPGLGRIVRDRGVISRCGHDRGWTAGQTTGTRRRVATQAGDHAGR